MRLLDRLLHPGAGLAVGVAGLLGSLGSPALGQVLPAASAQGQVLAATPAQGQSLPATPTQGQAVPAPAIHGQTLLAPGVEAISANDNRVAAGRLEAGILSMDLEVREGRWTIGDDHGPSAVVQAFAERGAPLSIPGPLIRVREGTRLRVTVHNPLADSLVVYGLHRRPGSREDAVRVAPGESRTVEFEAGAPGSYYYWATTTGVTKLDERESIDSQLYGALIVDPADAPDAPRDRIFVLGVWFVPADSTEPEPLEREVMTINGTSWPHTERIEAAVGDTLRWRVLNPTRAPHPMHLHGVYYNVVSRGSWAADTLYAPEQRRLVVTELMIQGSTMAMEWVASTPGNWLFHCHFAFHVSHFLSFDKVPDLVDPGAPDAVDHSAQGMRGLVLAISVDPKGAPEPEDPANPREVRLVAHAGRGTFGEAEGYTYTIEEPGQNGEPPTSLPAVGPLLLLRKGEPVRITVVNRLRCPHAVHWHGIEVQRSWPDGVPGWSGLGNTMAPAIAPGDSFVAAFTPPRAGTFIYHSHAHEGHQIASGLFGPLIVEDPARPFDRQSERLIVIGGDGPNFPSGRVNGELEPAPVELEAARTYRLRIVHMNPDGAAVVSLLARDQVLTWRPVAKDGADLPATQAVVGPARVLMGPGETIDVEVAFADPAELMLLTEHRRKEWRVETPIHVR